MDAGSAANGARRVGDLALWIAAVLGCCCLVLTVCCGVFGVRPLVFRSGSMAPTITTGSLGLTRPVAADAVQVGDIVSVPSGDSRVTHRVIGIRSDGAGTLLRLQGDANRVPDADSYRVGVTDKLWLAIPGLGGVIGWLSRPPGALLLAGYAAVMVALMLRRRRPHPKDHDHDEDSHDHDDGGRPRASTIGATSRSDQGRPHLLRLRAALAVILVGGVLAVSPSPTWAAFTDTVPAAGSRLSTDTVPAPTFSCGLLGIASLTFNWTTVPDATSYTLHYGNGGSSTVTTTKTSYTLVTPIRGGRAWVTADRDFGSTTWSSAASTERTYTIVLGLLSLCS